jgi:colicin import membrane protein
MSLLQKYALAFILALSLHFLIIGLFAFNFISEPVPMPKAQDKVPEIIEASILDENVVAEKAKELQQVEEKKRNQQQQQKELLAKQLKQEKLRIKQAKAKRLKAEKTAKIEAQRLQEVAKNEAKKLAAIKQALVLEKQKQAVIKQQRIAQEKALAAEKKRKQEAERIAEQQRKAAAKKKEAARKAAEKQKKMVAAKRAKENRIRAENARIAKKAVADAKVLIKQKIMQNWNQPNTVPDGLSCRIRVNLIPSSGDVMAVNVEKSSGNRLFDESAERAVLKAATLPVPKDPKIAEQFRSFTLLFDPKK